MIFTLLIDKYFRHMKKKLLLISLNFIFLFNILYAQNNDQIISGLKEALQVGTDNSVLKANKTNGYFSDSRIKIPFPKDADFVQKTLMSVPGVGPKLIDTLVLKINRAAEKSCCKG